MRRHAATILLVSACLAGCSAGSKPYQTAPVSGVVTLDGQPLAAARVTFLPQPDSPGASQTGPEATGETDADGRYALKTVFGDSGASVGKNRVMVTTRKTELDPNNADKSREVAKERVPGKYFTDQAPLVFDVPRGGTSAANFQLMTK